MTHKLINLGMIRNKFIKEKLAEIDNTIEELVITVKISLTIVSLTLFWLQIFSKMLYCFIGLN